MNNTSPSPHEKVQDIVSKWVDEGLGSIGSIESACDEAWAEIQKEVPECTLHIFGKYWINTYNFHLSYHY